MKQKPSATTLALAIALSATMVATPVQAGIPVIDRANLSRNLITAAESVAQTLKQIQQYSTQLLQYQNQLQNTMAPSEHIWGQARTTIDSLMQAINTLDHYKSQLGSLDNYIGKFQDVNYYQSSPCFSNAGCSQAEWSAMQQNRVLASESQKKANDALFKGLDKQQTNLQNDAATLQRLQSAAQGAIGQLQAIGYANQLASQQAHQLLQIRAMLIAQHNAIAAKMQADADRQAQETAADAHLRQSRYRPSPPRSW